MKLIFKPIIILPFIESEDNKDWPKELKENRIGFLEYQKWKRKYKWHSNNYTVAWYKRYNKKL